MTRAADAPPPATARPDFAGNAAAAAPAGPAGLILAGGLARRMGGGDKGLRLLDGRTLLSRVVERVRPQVAILALGANGDPARFAEFGLLVLPDPVPAGPGETLGPLAGVLAGLDWAAARGRAFLLTVPCDAPFLPSDLAARLAEARDREGADLACAASAGRDHPVAALWPVSLRGALRRALVEEGVRRVGEWMGRHRVARAEYPAVPVDPFFNANRPEDLAAAEAMLAGPGGAPASVATVGRPS